MARRLSALRILPLTFMFLSSFGGCPSSQSQTPTLTPEQATAALDEASAGFVTTGDDAAATKLESAMAGVFASYADFDAALDAAGESVFGSLKSANDLSALIQNSLLQNGRSVQGDETGPAASAKSSTAVTKVDCDTGARTLVVLINGINNSYAEFLESWAALGAFLNDRVSDIPHRVDGYYNVSGKDAEHSTFGGYVCPFAIQPAIIEFCRTLGFVVFDLALESTLQIANIERWGNFVPKAPDSERFAAFLRERIDDGWKVIIVSHSQGNFMASQAMELLDDIEGNQLPLGSTPALPIDAVGVISVGSPTNDFGPLPLDQIRPVMVRGEVMNTKVPGTDTNVFGSWSANAEPPSETLSVVERHNLNDSYLRSSSARDLIAKGVRELSCNLKNPRGKFRVSGRVVDFDKLTPIAGALVNVTTSEQNRQAAGSFTTDSDGNFGPYFFNHRNAVIPEVTLTVHKSGYTDKSVTRTFNPLTFGEDFVTIEIETDLTGGSDGTNSKTVCGLYSDDGHELPYNITLSGPTESNVGQTGKFQADGLSAYFSTGEVSYTWSVDSSSGAIVADASVSAGNAANLSVLSAGAVRVCVLAREVATGEAVAFRSTSVAVTAAPFWITSVEPVTSYSGEFNTALVIVHYDGTLDATSSNVAVNIGPAPECDSGCGSDTSSAGSVNAGAKIVSGQFRSKCESLSGARTLKMQAWISVDGVNSAKFDFTYSCLAKPGT